MFLVQATWPDKSVEIFVAPKKKGKKKIDEEFCFQTLDQEGDPCTADIVYFPVQKDFCTDNYLSISPNGTFSRMEDVCHGTKKLAF